MGKDVIRVNVITRTRLRTGVWTGRSRRPRRRVGWMSKATRKQRPQTNVQPRRGRAGRGALLAAVWKTTTGLNPVDGGNER